MTELAADRHRRLAAEFHATVAAVPPGATTNATPCEGWTVADVAHHVQTTQCDFLEQRGIAVEAGASAAKVSAVLQAALDNPEIAEASYDGFFGPTTLAEAVDAFYCLDLVLHRWDIAAAVGLGDHAVISDIDIERCTTLLEPMGDNIRMPGIFGPAVDPGPNPSPTDRFVAWAGRQPALC